MRAGTPRSWRPGWKVGGGLNGGYQLAVIGTAISAHLADKPDPVAISAYFLSAAEAGPATVDVEVKRAGGRMSTVAAELKQGDATRLSVLATYSDLDRFDGDVRTTATEPELPPREECVGRADVPSYVLEMAPLMSRFDMLFPREQAGWTIGEPSGEGRFQAWFRLEDEREPDPLSLLLVLDALPPVTFDLGLIGLGADDRALRARARQAGAGLAQGAAPHPQPRRRDVRGGLRGLGLHRAPGRAVAPAGAGAARLLSRASATRAQRGCGTVPKSCCSHCCTPEQSSSDR